MRSAQEILKQTGNGIFVNTFTNNEMIFLEDAVDAINEARKEAIEECVKRVRIEDEDYLLSLINELK